MDTAYLYHFAAVLLSVGQLSTSQWAVMLCGWGVKAGMVREWVAGKTV